jgi:hypothetical protein
MAQQRADQALMQDIGREQRPVQIDGQRQQFVLLSGSQG